MSSEKTEQAPLDRAATVLDSSSNPKSGSSSRAVSIIGTSLRFSERAPEVSEIEAKEFADRYEASSVLGEGGMGEVRLCRDARIGRDVAMKVIRGDRGGQAELRARFLREVRVQGQLEHPSIVPVYDLGVGGDGETYFTMKRVRGLTLADICDRLRMKDPAAIQQYSPRKLLAAFQSVCLAVEFAHSRGVLHRDLKPSNVMLGDFGEVYVLDWGIAKILSEPDEAGPRIIDSDQALETQIGSFVGTLGYLSPEQFSGAELDGRSDVFSLGAILFEMLTLVPLFEGKPIEVAGAIAEPVDARCSARAPAMEVAPELEAICVKATHLDRADRFGTARELHDAIGRYLDGDRDLERRKALAENHLRVAEDEMALAKEGSEAGHRSKALGELGRALALDPTNDAAIGDIVGLILEPPKELPSEVQTFMAESDASSHRAIGLTGLLAFPSGLLLVAPVLLEMDSAHAWIALVVCVCILASTGLCVLQVRRARTSISILVMFLLSVGFVAMTRIYGPLVLMPQMALSTGMVYGMHPHRRVQFLSMSLMILVIGVPVALELLGVWPPSYRFSGGEMTVISHAAPLDELTTIGVIGATTLFLMFAANMSIRRMRNALSKAEATLALQMWQFRQLVPERARRRFTEKTAV